MKKIDKRLKPIGITALIMATIIASNHVSANAGVVDNIQNSIAAILGRTNDRNESNFAKKSTNGKLNQMKLSVDGISETIDQLVEPYLGNLTVWVNETNSVYNGMSISITDSQGKTKYSNYVARNGHYEADFSNILKGNYTISYPYIISGKTENFTIQAFINAGTNRKQLFGNIFQMSMADIQAMCKVGIIHEMAHVGDTISDGTYTYTIIGINQDKPSDANGNLLDSSQYGDVLTLMAMGAPIGEGNGTAVITNGGATPFGNISAVMNDYSSNSGSWESTKMRNTTMPQYLEKLPSETRNVIGYVQKITGVHKHDSNSFQGYDSTGYANAITGDKCFLLSYKEISGDRVEATTNEFNATFQYQYFANMATTKESRNLSKEWWLRSPSVAYETMFCFLTKGNFGCAGAGRPTYVYPAFCIY
jgi:uncharacterized protein YcfJ